MNDSNSQTPRLISIAELCATLSIRRTKAFSLIRGREVTSIKIGRRTLIVAESVDEFITRCPRAGGR